MVQILLSVKKSNIYSTEIIYASCFTLIRDVTLCGWPAKQTIPLSVLARNQTKGFWTWNLGVAGRGNGTREEIWLEKGADRELATGHGQGQSTPDTVAERRVSMRNGPAKKIESQEMSAFQLLCGIFASNPC